MEKTMTEETQEIISLLKNSPSVFHVVKNIADKLLANGFIELDERKPFNIQKGKNYFVKRNNSSIIAFKIPSNCHDLSFFGTATHNDSPTYKLKPHPFVKKGNLTLLDVEPYGGMIHSTWLDRPLSIAGRVFLKKGDKIEEKLLDIHRPLLIIPNLAIHMNRTINDGYAYNPAIDLLPLFGEDLKEEETSESFLLQELQESKDAEILSHDLYLYNFDEPRTFGIKEEFLSSPRLDDLASAYSSLLGFLGAQNKEKISLFASFDNEEVGSLTRQGANSTFFKDTYRRISKALKGSFEQDIANSFLLSIDNAHANHPNHLDKSDQTTNVLLNKGIVIKSNANQSYTTDGFGSSFVKAIAKKGSIPFQEFTNRSDLRGGSTLGNISNSELSTLSCDVGLPQLAMHSANETMGLLDLDYMRQFVSLYFGTKVTFENNSFLID